VSKFSNSNHASLLKLLKEELGLWEQVYGLTDKQTQLLSSDDMDALDESIEARQILIEKIDGLHQDSDILMQSYISHASKIGDIEALKTKLRGLVASCAQLNERNLTDAKDVAENLTARAGKLGEKRKTIGAYALDAPNNPELFDKKL